MGFNKEYDLYAGVRQHSSEGGKDGFCRACVRCHVQRSSSCLQGFVAFSARKELCEHLFSYS